MWPSMIVIDLDDTLLHSDKSLSNYSMEIINECKTRGILITIATARFWIGAAKYIDILMPDYEITTDGALIHKKGEFIYGKELDLNAANKMICEIIEKYPHNEITTATANNIYRNKVHNETDDRLKKSIYNDYRYPMREPIYKIVTEFSSESNAFYFAKKYGFRMIKYRNESWYGFVNVNTEKAHAVKTLSEIVQISTSKIIAFGDDLNDVEMLKLCGIGVAVSNGVADTLSSADVIVDNNDNDGVAKYLYEYLRHR